jgi:hypothetical protein
MGFYGREGDNETLHLGFSGNFERGLLRRNCVHLSWISQLGRSFSFEMIKGLLASDWTAIKRRGPIGISIAMIGNAGNCWEFE